MTSVTVGLGQVRDRIIRAAQACDRDPGGIRLLAVSKTQPLEKLREAIEAGQRHFGENYMQDALPKIEALGQESLVWHFIGALQSNKTRAVARHFQWVHTVDRERIATRLNDQRPLDAAPLNICLQVAVADEPGKSGVEPAGLDKLARAVARLPRLRLRGLMCLPPPETEIERQRAHFRRLRQMADRLRSAGVTLDTLSMGMTHDLEAAIMEGATCVRVGTAIFGPRRSAPMR